MSLAFSKSKSMSDGFGEKRPNRIASLWKSTLMPPVSFVVERCWNVSNHAVAMRWSISGVIVSLINLSVQSRLSGKQTKHRIHIYHPEVSPSHESFLATNYSVVLTIREQPFRLVASVAVRKSSLSVECRIDFRISRTGKQISFAVMPLCGVRGELSAFAEKFAVGMKGRLDAAFGDLPALLDSEGAVQGTFFQVQIHGLSHGGAITLFAPFWLTGAGC